MFSEYFQRLPFDWQTPFGYFMALTFEFVSFLTSYSMLMPQWCLTLGSSWWIDIYINAIIHKLDEIDVLSNGSHADGKDHSLVQRQIRTIFCDIIQEISQVKEFSSAINYNEKHRF